MSVNEIVIGLVGEGNESGVGSAGKILTAAAAHSGFNVMTFREYPSRIWGGLNAFQVRISKNRIYSIGNQLDILVAFDKDNYNSYRRYLSDDGVAIFEAKDSEKINNKPKYPYPVPLEEIVKASGVQREFIQKGRNIVSLGVLSGLFNIPYDSIKEEIIKNFGKKDKQILEGNLNALKNGFDYASKLKKEDEFKLSTENLNPKERIVISGNEMIGLASILAGLDFFAGYPITPASSILEYLERNLPKYNPNGIVVQAEDEIASITMLAGASYAGAKVMTTTSGPGLSLMMEGIGQASMLELPMVIVDCQRAGPSTGMPTKTAQGDLSMLLGAGHGDTPKIILNVGDVGDCYYETIKAFNYAEKYQVPVILMMELALCDRFEAIGIPQKPVIINRLQPSEEDLKEYEIYRKECQEKNVKAHQFKRYKLTESGISPFPMPGTSAISYANSAEHDEYGYTCEKRENAKNMVNKRFKKLTSLECPELEDYYAKNKDPVDRTGEGLRFDVSFKKNAIIGWCGSKGVIEEVCINTNDKVDFYFTPQLYPFNKRLAELLTTYEKVIVPELNYEGQFAKYLKSMGINAVSFRKTEGYPFTVKEIEDMINEVAK